MKALTTQFDNGRLSNTVATPTCCCCCCCCCCLTTSVIATSALTDNVNKSCIKNKIEQKPLLITAAILSIPISLLVSQGLCSIIALLTYSTYETNPANVLVSSIGFRSLIFLISYILTVWGLYKTSLIKKPFIKSIKFVTFFSLTTILEAIICIFLVFNNANNGGATGLVIYIIASLLIIASYIVIKRRSLTKAKK